MAANINTNNYNNYLNAVDATKISNTVYAVAPHSFFSCSLSLD